jgi:hypothetical protein
MRERLARLGIAALAGLFLLAAVARTDEEGKKAAKVKVPKKVMDAVKARFPGAKITKVGKETADGKVVYDIELTSKGRKYEMDIQADGTVLEVEKELRGKEVPDAVRKALRAKYPKAKIKVVMEVNKVMGKKEVPDHYEVILETAGKKEVEVTVSLDGKTVKAPDKQ